MNRYTKLRLWMFAGSALVAVAGHMHMSAYMSGFEAAYDELPPIEWLDSEPVTDENHMLPALVKTESNGNPDALSNKGAAGMYQIMPETARNPGHGVKPLQDWDRKDPRTAPIHEQKRFANDLLNATQARYDGNPVLAAASYNAGAGAVDRAMKKAKGDVDKAITLLPAETRAYVVKVTGYEQQVASIWSPVDRGRHE